MTFPKKFKSFAGGKGGNSFGGGFKKRGFSGNTRDDVEKHPAVCAKCGDRCEVPFKPNGRKPIYCSLCFVKDDAAPKRFGDQRSSKPGSKPAFDGTAEQFKIINAKLDAILKAIADRDLMDKVL